MRNFIDTAEDFESWILQSRKHKFIADLSWDEFFRLQKIPISHADDSLCMVAMLESTMMNWGFSIENAIKGVLVAKEPKIVTNGHIKKMVADGPLPHAAHGRAKRPHFPLIKFPFRYAR